MTYLWGARSIVLIFVVLSRNGAFPTLTLAYITDTAAPKTAEATTIEASTLLPSIETKVDEVSVPVSTSEEVPALNGSVTNNVSSYIIYWEQIS